VKSFKFLLQNGADPDIIRPGVGYLIDICHKDFKPILQTYSFETGLNFSGLVEKISSDISDDDLSIMLRYSKLSRKGQFEILKYVLALKNRDDRLKCLKDCGIGIDDFQNELYEYIENNRIGVNFARNLLKHGIKLSYERVKLSRNEKSDHIISFMQDLYNSQKGEYEKQIELLNDRVKELGATATTCAALVNSFIEDTH